MSERLKVIKQSTKVDPLLLKLHEAELIKFLNYHFLIDLIKMLDNNHQARNGNEMFGGTFISMFLLLRSHKRKFQHIFYKISKAFFAFQSVNVCTLLT